MTRPASRAGSCLFEMPKSPTSSIEWPPCWRFKGPTHSGCAPIETLRKRWAACREASPTCSQTRRTSRGAVEACAGRTTTQARRCGGDSEFLPRASPSHARRERRHRRRELSSPEGNRRRPGHPGYLQEGLTRYEGLCRVRRSGCGRLTRHDTGDCLVAVGSSGGLPRGAAAFLRRGLAISSDAHTKSNLEYMRFGVDQGRWGWLEPEDVLNTRSWRELKRLLARP